MPLLRLPEYTHTYIIADLFNKRRLRSYTRYRRQKIEYRLDRKSMVSNIREKTQTSGSLERSRTTSEAFRRDSIESTRSSSYLPLRIRSLDATRRNMYNMIVHREVHLPNRYKIGAAATL